jgi:hypothetical protein
MYYHGKGVSRDYKEAMRWYTKAAEQGNAQAQYFVGGMYAIGRGSLFATILDAMEIPCPLDVPRDYQTAYVWLSLAVASGHGKEAAALRDEMARKLHPQQLETAKARVKELTDTLSKRTT